MPVIGTSLVLGRLLDVVDEMVLLNRASAPKILLLEMNNISSWASSPWRESSANSTIIIGSFGSHTRNMSLFFYRFLYLCKAKSYAKESNILRAAIPQTSVLSTSMETTI